ncbi:hypothetical protein V1512DRAFT_261674 [Lipomyces arxii]|uniref:uncharacterized protein n=1 Tax=Lipomyces arxii TaxID=56418 RepID=UPI0034CE478A
MASASAQATAPELQSTHQRLIAPRPVLRPILPKPPAATPVSTVPMPTVSASSNATKLGSVSQQSSVTSQLGSRIMGSMASSIFSGSTTITLPPRPSASRSKAKKRASPSRVLVPDVPEVVVDKPHNMAVNAAALKKRRRQKLPSTSAATLVSAPPASALPASTVSLATTATATSTPPFTAAATPLRHSNSTRAGIAIPHTTPQQVRTEMSSQASASMNAFDIDALSPGAFSLPSGASDLWWPNMDSSAASTPSVPPLYESDISIDSSSSSLSSASLAAHRRLDRASSSTSSLSSSIASSAYFSDSTISTAISSIVINEEPSEFETGSGKFNGESDISEMIHRLITGDGPLRERSSSIGSFEEDDEEMLFATPSDTTSVRKSRAGSDDTTMADARVQPRQTKPDPLRALFAMTPASLSSISSSTKPSDQESSPQTEGTPASTPGTPIPMKSVNRSMSEPASITIPAEKNSFEDDTESEFILNREMLVRKGLVSGCSHRHSESVVCFCDFCEFCDLFV